MGRVNGQGVVARKTTCIGCAVGAWVYLRCSHLSIAVFKLNEQRFWRRCVVEHQAMALRAACWRQLQPLAGKHRPKGPIAITTASPDNIAPSIITPVTLSPSGESTTPSTHPATSFAPPSIAASIMALVKAVGLICAVVSGDPSWLYTAASSPSHASEGRLRYGPTSLGTLAITLNVSTWR